MTPTEQLLTLSRSYCAARGISERTASGIVFRDSRTIVRVKNGGSLTMRNFERAIDWFQANWPSDHAWPIPAAAQASAKEGAA